MSSQMPESRIDVEAISGILGSISIACWVVVFSPQIVENFRRRSTDGLSLLFIVVWLLGDIFNILGAVLQGLLPTMIILAVYYTFADIVLLLQCFYYRGLGLSDAARKESAQGSAVADENEGPSEGTPLLGRDDDGSARRHLTASAAERTHRRSSASFRSHLTAVDGAHLSPATPLVAPRRASSPPATRSIKPTSTVAAVLFNSSALLLVCLAGLFGWWLSTRSARLPFDGPSGGRRRPGHRHRRRPAAGRSSADVGIAELAFDVRGQIFGYLCALFYLGSRVPQLLLNRRRKSTEGVSMLFFLFACVGNLTYVLSIFAYEPECARLEGADGPAYGCAEGEWARGYARYVAVNASWLIGSAGTLLLDLGIFAQFWMYRAQEGRAGSERRRAEDRESRR